MHTVQVKLPWGAHLSLARLLRGGVVWHAMATIMPHKQHHWQTFHAIAKAEGSALRSYICFQHASAVYMLPVGLGWGAAPLHAIMRGCMCGKQPVRACTC